MNSNLIKRILIALLGCITLGAGIGMSIKVGIGVDSLSAFYTAIAKITGLSDGTVTALANAVMITLALILYKKNVGISTVMFMLTSKWPIDFANKHFIHSDNLIVSIILCIFSMALIALGSELCIFSDLGADAYTAMTMGVGKRLKHEVKYTYIRWFFDITFLILAIILKGEVGLGTAIAIALVGPMMKLFEKGLRKIIK